MEPGISIGMRFLRSTVEPRHLSRTSISLLYVEDEADCRDCVGRWILTKYPAMELHSAENGEIGLSLFKAHRPDIVLTDISLPVKNGIQMAREIRAIDAQTHIIVLTAHSDTDYLLEAIKLGINRYVLKPIVMDPLLEALDDCVYRIDLERRVKEQHEYIRKLSRALEQSPNVVVITNADGTIEYVNTKFTDLTGYTLDEARGRTPRILKSESTLPEVYENLWKTITAGREWRGELLNRKKSGEKYWESASISPLFNENGEISHYICVSEDITERKQKDNLLRESEERFRSLFEGAPDAIFLAEPATGTILDANPAAAHLLGRCQENIRGMHQSQLHHQRLKDSAKKGFRRHARLALNDIIPEPIESFVICADGAEIPVEIRSQLISICGRPVLQGIFRDITEHKRIQKELLQAKELLEQRVAERTAELKRALDSLREEMAERSRAENALTQTEALLQAVIEILPVGIEVTDSSGTFTMSNRANRVIWRGQGQLDMVKTNSLEGRLQKTGMRLNKEEWPLFRAASHGETVLNEIIDVKFRNGSRKTIENSAVSIRNDTGEIIAAVAVAEDITKRHTAVEKLMVSHDNLRSFSTYQVLAVEKERTRIAREIHDELGQVLASVRMGVSLLAAEYSDHHHLTKKISSMEQLLEGTIKTVRRIIAELRPQMLDVLGLGEVIEWQATEFRKNTGIDCNTVILLPEARFDRDISTAVYRIFQETLTNIMRHAGANRVDVTLVERNRRLILIVKDNGKGITRGQLKGNHSFGILGMRERVNAFGGRIRICGSPSKGTVVIARIPILTGAGSSLRHLL